MDRAKRRAMFEAVDLYPVTCQALSSGRSDLDVLEGVVKGGAKIVQLREKDLSRKDFYELALRFREITSLARVLFMVNDHLDVALAVNADGVHLGQDDLPLAAARRLAPQLLIGVSTHSLSQALDAQRDGADYVNIGPIFPTGTKKDVESFLGPESIGDIAPRLRIPFTVMGGITEDNIDRVLAQGARKVAVVTAVTKAPDIPQAVRALREKILAGN